MPCMGNDEQMRAEVLCVWGGGAHLVCNANNVRIAHWSFGGPCYPPPPLYKLRPCPSYSRRRDRINLGPNFNSVPTVVQPHKTWVS